MTHAPSNFSASVEQREYARVPTAIPSTLSILADRIALACVVTDLSASGAGVQFDEPAPPAERICRLEISWFGAFEGITTRDGGTSAGVRFLIGEAERLDLLAKLAKFVEVGLSPATDDDFLETVNPKLLLKLPSGQRTFCEVLNISLRGVLLKTEIRPPIGELVKAGSMYGRVETHQAEGLGITFVSAALASERLALAL
jgi:hypothetical protein